MIRQNNRPTNKELQATIKRILTQMALNGEGHPAYQEIVEREERMNRIAKG